MTDDITYEPTREHWPPYEPWMRDVLADDARLSWIDADSDSDPVECRLPWNSMTPVGRARWDTYRRRTDSWAAGVDFRVHPDDIPERPTDVDPDEALAKAICHSLDFAESSMLGEAVTAAVKDVLAAGWFPDVERLTRERDEWKARYEALRADVEEMRHDFDRGLWPDFKGVLARDTERGEQA